MRRSAYVGLLFAASTTGCAYRAGTSGGDLAHVGAPSDSVVGRAFARTRQGHLIATVDTSGFARIRDADANRVVASFRSPERKWRDYVAGPPITFNWDGTRLAIGSSDGAIRIWRVSDGRLLHTLRAPKLDMFPQSADGSLRRYTGDQPTTGVAFSPDDSLLASTSANGRGTLWRIGSGEAFAILLGANGAGYEGAAPRVTIAFAPNGKAIAVGTPNTPIIVYTVPTAVELPSLGGPADPANLVFSPDADLLASADRNGAFVMWSLGLHDALWVSGTTNYNLHRDSRVEGVVAFSPNGNRVAGLDAQGTLFIWETRTGLELARYETSLSAARVWFSADGRDVMAADMVGGNSMRFSAPLGRTNEAQLQALAEPRVPPATAESNAIGNAIGAETGRRHAGFKATVSRTEAVFTIPMPSRHSWHWSTAGVGRESVEYTWEAWFDQRNPKNGGLGCMIRGRRPAPEQSGSLTTLVGECRPFTFQEAECGHLSCRSEKAEPALRASNYNGSVVLRLSNSEALRRLWSDHPDSVLLRAELRAPDTGYVDKEFVVYRH